MPGTDLLAGTLSAFSEASGGKNRSVAQNNAWAFRVPVLQSGKLDGGFRFHTGKTASSATALNIAVFTDAGGEPSQTILAVATATGPFEKETTYDVNELIENPANEGKVKEGEFVWVVFRPAEGNITTFYEKSSGGAEPYKDATTSSFYIPQTFGWNLVAEPFGPMDVAALGTKNAGAKVATTGGGRTTIVSGVPIGQPSVGPETATLTADRKRVVEYDVPGGSGFLPELWVWLSKNAAGTQKVKAVVYEYDATAEDNVGALIAEGTEVEITGAAAGTGAWFRLPLPTEPFLSGKVFIGWIAGATNNVLNYRYFAGSGLYGGFNTDTYEGGASDPFGSLPVGNQDGRQPSIYGFVRQTGALNLVGDVDFSTATGETLVGEETEFVTGPYFVAPGEIPQGAVRMAYTGVTGTAVAQLIIYREVVNQPGKVGALLAVSKGREFHGPGSAGAFWEDFLFDTPVVIDGANIFIGLMLFDPAGVVELFWNTQAAVRKFTNARVLVPGPKDPFGTPTAEDNHRTVVYVEFLPTGWKLRTRGGGKTTFRAGRLAQPTSLLTTGGGRTTIKVGKAPEPESAPVVEVEGIETSGGGKTTIVGRVPKNVIATKGGGRTQITGASKIGQGALRTKGGGKTVIAGRAGGAQEYTDNVSGNAVAIGLIRESFRTAVPALVPTSTGSDPELRVIDPSTCRVRHIVRAQATDFTAQPVAGDYFGRAEAINGEDGLQGRQGWQGAEVNDNGADDSGGKVALGNVEGDDGILHRRRFKVLTDPDYEPGEEWLEIYRDEQLLLAGTPTGASKSWGNVGLRLASMLEVLNGSYSSEVDVWDATAPADVFKHYSRLKVLPVGRQPGSSFTLSSAATRQENLFGQPLPNLEADCWTVEARVRVRTITPSTAKLQASLTMEVFGQYGAFLDLFDSSTFFTNQILSDSVEGKKASSTPPGTFTFKIVCLYDHLFAFINGELMAEYRRSLPWNKPTDIYIRAVAVAQGSSPAWSHEYTFEDVKATTLVPYAGRGPSAVFERRLPGLPPATGLRAQYYDASAIYYAFPTTGTPETQRRLARLFKLSDTPKEDRVEPQVNHASPADERAPGIATAFAARYSGSILLDLAKTDYQVRIKGLLGPARIYVGKTLRSQEAGNSWEASPSVPELQTPLLRSWIGSTTKGWYPIVVEIRNGTSGLGVVLEYKEGAGAWVTVPTSNLSPVGCYADVVRLTSHRAVLGKVASDFGYQWREEPRTLESGEFPGQLTFKVLNGRPVDLKIDDEDLGSQPEAEVEAKDVVDSLLADAAGFADPNGAGQLTAEISDYVKALGHVAFRQQYDSAADITELPMLQARLLSLLLLRESPNEQVGVRPSPQRDLVDTFPLTGSLAKFLWRPYDAPRLALERIDVIDLSPRQLTQANWILRPDGVASLQVGFRQRPHSVRDALRRFASTMYAPRRTYQGSATVLTATTLGVNTVQYAGTPEGIPDGKWDPYTRVALPPGSKVLKATLFVVALTGSGWYPEVNFASATGIKVNSVGPYDITPLVAPYQKYVPYLFVRLLGGSGANSDGYNISLHVEIAN